MKARYGYSVLSLILAVLLNTSLSSFAYSAESLFSSPVLTNIQISALPGTQQSTNERRYVNVNRSLISRESQQLQLDLLNDEFFLLKRSRFQVKAGRGNIWRGDLIKQHMTGNSIIEERVGSAVFIIKNGLVQATIHHQNETYKLEPVGNDLHVLRKVNISALPPEHPEDTTIPLGSASSNTNVDSSSTDTSSTDTTDITDTIGVSSAGTSFTGAAVAVASLEVIRALVLYSPAASNQTFDIEGAIDLAIANTNSSYANSGIGEAVSVEVAHSTLFNYVEDGNIFLDLQNTQSDPFIQQLRDEHLADVVIMVVGVSEYCGLASSINATTENAYAVVFVTCLAEGVYSLAHELGHLQGARHDIAADASSIPFPDGHGYVDLVNGFRTIMAYPCINGEIDECPRIPYWSNITEFYLGQAIGIDGISNNARVLAETAPAVANLWINHIPYNLLYQVGFHLHELNEPPLLSTVSIKTPTTISAGSPLIAAEFGVFDTKNLVFDGSSETFPFREAVTFDIREDVERLDISMDLTTQNLMGTANAQGFINLNFDQPIELTMAQSGWLQIDGQNIAPVDDASLINIGARLHFIEDTLEILVNDTSVHLTSLLSNNLNNIEVGITGSDQHQMALDNLLVTSNGIGLSELEADFILESAGAWSNGQISFTAAFSNNGPNLAENLIATVAIPADVNLDSYSSDSLNCLYDNFLVSCTAINLAANDEAQVSIVTSTPDSNTRFPFSLSTSSDAEETVLDDNYKTFLLGGDGVLADLAVTLSGSNKTVGSRIYLTIMLINNGPDSADEIVLTVPTPGSVGYESGDHSACIVNDINATRIICGVDQLLPGESFQTTLTYYSPFFFTRPTFTASVAANTLDPNTVNNSANGVFGGVFTYFAIGLMLLLWLGRPIPLPSSS